MIYANRMFEKHLFLDPTNCGVAGVFVSNFFQTCLWTIFSIFVLFQVFWSLKLEIQQCYIITVHNAFWSDLIYIYMYIWHFPVCFFTLNCPCRAGTSCVLIWCLSYVQSLCTCHVWVLICTMCGIYFVLVALFVCVMHDFRLWYVQLAVTNFVASLRAGLASLGRAWTKWDGPWSIPFIKANRARPMYMYMWIYIYIYTHI